MVGSFFGDGETDEPAPVARHKVDGLGSNKLGGQRKVALVLAILVVDHNNHAAGANLIQRARHVGKGRLEAAGGVRHGAVLLSPIRGWDGKGNVPGL